MKLQMNKILPILMGASFVQRSSVSTLICPYTYERLIIFMRIVCLLLSYYGAMSSKF